jgi:serine/threonine-protein kinase
MLLNLNKPRQVTVPNIVGLTTQEAREVLKDSNLEMKVDARLPDDNVAMDKILEVRPGPGEKVIEDSRVSVIISSGSRFVAVPDLRGLTVDKARTVLANLGLELDPDMLREGNPNVAAGMVVRSSPAAKAKIERESRVKLVVSTGIGGGGDPGTTVEGKFLYKVRLKLDDLTEPTSLRVDMEDTEGVKTIFEEERNSGDRVELTAIGKGETATFRIYYNGLLVKTVPAKAGDTDIE